MYVICIKDATKEPLGYRLYNGFREPTIDGAKVALMDGGVIVHTFVRPDAKSIKAVIYITPEFACIEMRRIESLLETETTIYPKPEFYIKTLEEVCKEALAWV